MLSDLVATITTPLSPPLRALGYLDETLAMRRRARRNREAWQPHLENTRRFVLSSAEKCRSRAKAVILGSGLLLDVPLAGLSELFRDVVLMDVVCLPEIRKRINRYKNVTFIEHDATGIAEGLHQMHRSGTATLPEPARPVSAYDDASLVVSLNVLSQLWVVPRAFVGMHLRAVTPEQAEEWCGRIVESHYTSIRDINCDVCLVGDYEFVTRDHAGNVIGRGSTVYGLTLPRPDATWTWNIVPIGKDSPYASRELLVGGWQFHGESSFRASRNDG